MERLLSRRELLKGAFTVGGLLLASTRIEHVVPVLAEIQPGKMPLRILHLSDFHWGYHGVWNRHLDATFDRVLEVAKNATPTFDLILVTGDLIQATSNFREREERLKRVKQGLDALKIPWRAIPGEHDTFGDKGALFEKTIGPLSFHEIFHGVHVVGLDNVSRGYFLGRDQIAWLRREIEPWNPQTPAIILSHAPLYDFFTPWNWYTFDGAQAFSASTHLNRVLFLFGHVHQLTTYRHGHAMNYSGLPTAWPLPQPGPLERLSPWPQGATNPDMGLGFRTIQVYDHGFVTQVEWLSSLDNARVTV